MTRQGSRSHREHLPQEGGEMQSASQPPRASLVWGERPLGWPGAAPSLKPQNWPLRAREEKQVAARKKDRE